MATNKKSSTTPTKSTTTTAAEAETDASGDTRLADAMVSGLAEPVSASKVTTAAPRRRGRKVAESRKKKEEKEEEVEDDGGWTITQKVGGREVKFTKAEALTVVVKVVTRIKGVDGKDYVLPPPQRKRPSIDGKPAVKQITVLTSTKLFPFYNKMRQPRPLIKYNGDKPEPGAFKIVAPSVSAYQI